MHNGRMAQHFLLSAKARTLSLAGILRMSDDEAHAQFEAIRWADNGGAAFCPRCECTVVYAYTTRRIWKCKACGYQFSVTSGTIFASRKLPIRDYLAAIAIFVNAAKGISALQLGRDLDVQYKTAFVLAHKLPEAIGAEQSQGTLSGVVESMAPTSAAISGKRTKKRIAPIAGWQTNRPASASQSWSPVSATVGRLPSWFPRKPMRCRSSVPPCSPAPRSMPMRPADGIGCTLTTR